MRFFIIAAALGAAAAPATAAEVRVFNTGQSEFTPGSPNQGVWNTALPVASSSALTRAGFWFIPNPVNPLVIPGPAEIRGFFTFDLRGVNLGGRLTQVQLRIPNGTNFTTAAIETVGFFDVSTPAAELNRGDRLPPADLFADLGSGVRYARHDYVTGTPASTLLTIDLSELAEEDVLAAIRRSDFFSIGMTLLSSTGDARVEGRPLPPAAAGPDAFLEVAGEWRPGVNGPNAELLLTVPEPPVAAVLAGALGLGFAGRRFARRPG